MTDEDRATKNRQIVEELRAEFAPLLERLTAEIEPVLIYSIADSKPENEE